jgi:hypothetical protein
VASISTWKSFLMVFTKGSYLSLMSVMPCPTTVPLCQVSQPRSRAYTQVRHSVIHHFSNTATERQARANHLRKQ